MTEKLSSVLYRIKYGRKEKVVHHDRLKKCSDRTVPIWLTRLQHAVTKDVSLPKQDREEGTDEDACCLDSLFSDEGPDIVSGVSGDQAVRTTIQLLQVQTFQVQVQDETQGSVDKSGCQRH